MVKQVTLLRKQISHCLIVILTNLVHNMKSKVIFMMWQSKPCHDCDKCWFSDDEECDEIYASTGFQTWDDTEFGEMFCIYLGVRFF